MQKNLNSMTNLKIYLSVIFMCLYKPSNMKNEYHEEQDQEEQQQMWFLGASGKPINTITFKNFISPYNFRWQITSKADIFKYTLYVELGIKVVNNNLWQN